MKKKLKSRTKPTGVHNADWRKNDALIRNVYTEELKKSKRMPTQARVAEICGITEKTVNTHLHSVDFNELIKPFKLYGSDVLQGLAEKAKEGDPAAIRLFMFLVFDKVERKDIIANVEATVKVKKDVKVTISPKIAKLIGDTLAKDSGQ
jgi:hypothetical protein